MEWVETTAKSLEEAKEIALDRLGIGPDDAEFEILEEPRTGLFGRVRGEARVRARVKPATVRPKQDRRNRRRSEGESRRRGSGESRPATDTATSDTRTPVAATTGAKTSGSADAEPGSGTSRSRSNRRQRRRSGAAGTAQGGAAATAGQLGADATEATATSPAGGADMTDDTEPTVTGPESPAAPADVAGVQAAAEEFAAGLVRAFGVEGSTSSTASGNEIDVQIEGQGDGLGLLIGPGGRTLLAIQDLARVAAQRRLGDHETRLRVDVAGYREKRRAALEKFARHVAELVLESGIARSLDPMPSPDRKVVHDTLAGIEGVATRSEGEEPYRRIVVTPAER